MQNYIMEMIGSLAIGIISYFLKKTMDRLEKTEQKTQGIEKDYVTELSHKEDVKRLEDEVVKIREDYTPKEEFKKVVDEFRTDIKGVSDKFLTKEDFYREQSKMEKKLDNIIDLLVKEHR